MVEALPPATIGLLTTLDALPVRNIREPHMSNLPEHVLSDVGHLLLELSGVCKASSTLENPKRLLAPGVAHTIAALRFMGSHLDSHITLLEIARASNCSQFHLCREFRRVTGVTPMYALRVLRILQAVNLLQCSNMPIKAICAVVGLPAISTFDRLFRTLIGSSPHAIRHAATLHDLIPLHLLRLSIFTLNLPTNNRQDSGNNQQETSTQNP